jgi:predicted secreted protein
MRPTSIAAIYLLFWMLSLFLVLPWGVRTSEEEGAQSQPGHAESAPHIFRAKRVVLWTTLVATILFGLYYANYINGWIGVDELDWLS